MWHNGVRLRVGMVRCPVDNLPFGSSTIVFHTILNHILNATFVGHLLGFDAVVVLLLASRSFHVARCFHPPRWLPGQ